MGVFESLKKGFGILKQSVPLFLTIFGFNLLTALGMITVTGINPTPEKIASITGLLITLFPILIAMWIFMEGGIFSAVYSQIRTQQLAMDSFVGNCAKYFLRLFGINIIGGIFTVVVWFVGAFLMGIFIAMGGGNNIFFNALGAIMLLVTVICAFLVAIPLLLGQYFAVVEDGKAMDSLKKGFAFTKQFFWKTVGIFLLLALTVSVLSLMANFIGALFYNTIGGWIAAIINIVLNSAINGAIGVFASATIITFMLGVLTQKTAE